MKVTLGTTVLLAGSLLFHESFAAEPAPSNTNLIKVLGYCIGENMVRTQNLTDLIKANGQQVKDIQEKTDLDADARKNQADDLGHVGASMVLKSMATSA